ncbi:MAG TPA: hypothetical protein PKY81_18020, partial [bacterium]|nr:hypothetical protein [bacterium]
MKRILSYGGGVNSTAILALMKLGEYPTPDLIVFCDTGAEKQDTYCYLKYISKLFPIKIIKSELGGLIDYCKKYKIIPTIMQSFCTHKFKIRPFDKLIKNQDYIKILGIDYGERHRKIEGSNTEYPLIEMKIDRNDCIEIIKKAGLEIPVKSGCYICPNMRMSELKNLRENFPEYFQILVNLEKEANERRNDIFFKPHKKGLIESYCNDNQPYLP